jgi:hypothetical protein
MLLRVFLPLLSVAMFAQAPFRPVIRSLSFPMVESSVMYGLIGGGFSAGGTFVTTSTAARSDNGGANWTALYVAPQGEYQFVDQIVVHPERPLTVLAVQSRARGGLFRSVDGGQTWAPATPAGFELATRFTAWMSRH